MNCPHCGATFCEHINSSVERMRRKRDQAWELAGLARKDGDLKDEQRWTNEARNWSLLLGELST